MGLQSGRRSRPPSMRGCGNKRMVLDEVENEFARGEEQDEDEDEGHGPRLQTGEPPARSDVRSDEYDGHQDRDEDERLGHRKRPGADPEGGEERAEPDGRGRDDQEGRRPDREAGLPAPAGHGGGGG